MMSPTLRQTQHTSFFTRLDFRSKLGVMLSVTIVAFLWENPVLSALLTLSTLVACYGAGVQKAYLKSVLTLLIPFYAFIFITQGFFAGPTVMARTGQITVTPLLRLPAHWWLVGGGTLSLEGVLYGVTVICKTMTMTLVLPLAVFTTDINTILISLVKLGIPYKLAFIFTATLRFFPLLFAEVHAILEAQRLRGLVLSQMGPIRRLQVYARIAVPLILGALVRSQHLDIVLQSKAFSGNADRTYLHESHLGKADYVTLVVASVFLVGAILGYAMFGIGKF